MKDWIADNWPPLLATGLVVGVLGSLVWLFYTDTVNTDTAYRAAIAQKRATCAVLARENLSPDARVALLDVCK